MFIGGLSTIKREHDIIIVMKKIVLVFITLIICLSFFVPVASAASEGNIVYAKIIEQETEKVYVEELKSDFIVQNLKIEVYSEGNFKGRKYNIKNEFKDGDYNEYFIYHVGDKIKVELFLSEEGYVLQSEIYNVVRYQYLIWVLGLFIVLLLLIGRLKGLKTIITLTITTILVIFIMLPLIKKGYPPLPIAIVVCTLTTAITFVIMSGFNRKAICAITGTLTGLIGAAIVAGIVTNLASMTGVSSEDSGYLMYNREGIVYNLKGLLLTGILIGCLGAVMDVAMSVSSALFEVNRTSNAKLSAKELFKSGMNVGCDVIGTMSNTLILAYTGGALTFILVLMSYGIPFTDMLNHDFIMAEILRAMAGSIGMLITVPGTALICSLLISRKNNNMLELSDEQELSEEPEYYEDDMVIEDNDIGE